MERGLCWACLQLSAPLSCLVPLLVPVSPHPQPRSVPTDDEDSDYHQESFKESYKDQRRRAHTQAEQKRRDAIKVRQEAAGSAGVLLPACPSTLLCQHLSVLLLDVPSPHVCAGSCPGCDGLCCGSWMWAWPHRMSPHSVALLPCRKATMTCRPSSPPVSSRISPSAHRS